MKTVIILCSLLTTCLAFSQSYSVDTVSEKCPYFPGEPYAFPILKGGDELVTNKINTHLTTDFLDKPYLDNEPGLFKEVWGTQDNPYPQLSEIDFEVKITNKIYSIEINALGCGAYCEQFHTTYSYDLNTGDLITLDTLIETILEAELLTFLELLKSNTINKQLLSIDEMCKNDSISEDNKAYYLEMKDMYNDCLRWSKYENLNYFEFIVKDGFIILESGRCSAHVNRALDEIGSFEFKFKIDKIEKYLSPYGKKLLLNS